MKSVIKRNIAQLVLHFAALIISLVGIFSVTLTETFVPTDLVRFFTLLSNIALCAACLFTIPFNIIRITGNNVKNPRLLFTFRFITAISVFVTFLTVVCYLDPIAGFKMLSDMMLVDLTLHYIAPILFIVAFVLFDVDTKRHKINILFSPLLVIIYASYTVALVSLGKWADPYGFLNFAKFISEGYIYLPFAIVGAFLIGCYLLGTLLFVLNRISGKAFNKNNYSYDSNVDDFVPVTKFEDEIIPEDEIIIQEEPVKEEEKKEIKETKTKKVSSSKKLTTKKEVETKKEKPTEKKEITHRNYHVVKRQDGKWEVKYAGGKRAIKLFATQKEAVEYSKVMAANQDGVVLVHNSKGKNKGRIKSK